MSDEMTIAEGLNELEAITTRLTQDEIDLESGVKDYKTALEIAKQLKTKLDKLELEIKEIKANFDQLDKNEAN